MMITSMAFSSSGSAKPEATNFSRNPVIGSRVWRTSWISSRVLKRQNHVFLTGIYQERLKKSKWLTKTFRKTAKLKHIWPVRCSRVWHGVAVIPVGLDLEDQRTLSAAAVVDGELGGLAHGQDIHTVDLVIK